MREKNTGHERFDGKLQPVFELLYISDCVVGHAPTLHIVLEINSVHKTRIWDTLVASAPSSGS